MKKHSNGGTSDDGGGPKLESSNDPVTGGISGSGGGSKMIVDDREVSTLIGKHLRVYKTGDGLDKDLNLEDFNPERVNIEISEENEIISIWMG